VELSSPNVSIGLYLGVTCLFDLYLFKGCSVNWTKACTEQIDTGNGLKWQKIYQDLGMCLKFIKKHSNYLI